MSEAKAEAFARKQNQIASKVIKLVRKHPEVMEDYRKLVYYFWYYQDGLVLYLPKEKLLNLTNPESIGRAFRKLVEKGTIQIPDAVKKGRDKEEGKFHAFYSPRMENQSNLDGFFGDNVNKRICPNPTCKQQIDIDLEECPYCGFRSHE